MRGLDGAHGQVVRPIFENLSAVQPRIPPGRMNIREHASVESCRDQHGQPNAAYQLTSAHETRRRLVLTRRSPISQERIRGRRIFNL